MHRALRFESVAVWALLASGLGGCVSASLPADASGEEVSPPSGTGAGARSPGASGDAGSEAAVLDEDAAATPDRPPLFEADGEAVVLDWRDGCAGLDVSRFTFTYRFSPGCCYIARQVNVSFAMAATTGPDGCAVSFASDDGAPWKASGLLEASQVDVLAELSAHLRAHLSAAPASEDPFELAVEDAQCVPHRILVERRLKDPQATGDRSVLVCPRLADAPTWLSDAESLLNELLGHPHDCDDGVAVVAKCTI